MSNPFDTKDLRANPFIDSKQQKAAHNCPVCKSTNFRAFSNQYGLMRICNDCKNEWSGGTVLSPDLSRAIGQLSETPEGNQVLKYTFPPQGLPAPDDYPATQYTGAGFRDPSKNFDGDE